jgi:hypothetical protein
MLLHLAVVAVLAVVAARSLRDRQRRGLVASGCSSKWP